VRRPADPTPMVDSRKLQNNFAPGHRRADLTKRSQPEGDTLRRAPRRLQGALPLVPRSDGRALRAGAPRSDCLGRRPVYVRGRRAGGAWHSPGQGCSVCPRGQKLSPSTITVARPRSGKCGLPTWAKRGWCYPGAVHHRDQPERHAMTIAKPRSQAAKCLNGRGTTEVSP
jgi:hypothetical protein